MATMMEETQFSNYSAGHLSASYESPLQSNYAVAPIPYRACAGLSSVPVYDSNLTFNTFYDPNQPLIDIHPDEMVGSNTEAPPELAYVAQLTPEHILTQVQQGRFRPSISAPSTPESPSFKYLPPGAFHTKPLMRRSSNIPVSHSVPAMKMDYEDGMQMMVDQPSYITVDGNGEYLQDISSHYEQPLQQTVNYENTETFLQPHSQIFAKPDAYSPAPTSISVDYSPSPSLPITPPPSGTFPQHSYYIHQQQMMSQYVSVAMHNTGPVPLSSPSISEDGCCNPRSLFVNPSAIATEVFNTPRSVVSSPEHEQHPEVAEHLAQTMKVESPASAHGMEDVTASTPLERDLSPKPTNPVKVPAARKPSKRIVATPPRKRQSSAMSRKPSTLSAPALDSQPSVLDSHLVQSVPVRGRVPKRLKDALVALAPGSATPERAQSVAMSREQTLMPMQLEPSAVIESRPHSRLNNMKEGSPLSSPKTPAYRNRSSKKRKARHSSAPILPTETTKLFICDVLGCEKRFRRSEHLKRHARSLHTLEKPYVCNQPDCNKKFSRSDNLNQHLRVHKRNAEEATGVPYVEPMEDIKDEDEEEQEEIVPATPAPPTPEQAPPSPVKVAPKRRRGGPKSVGAAAPKRRNRQAPPPTAQDNIDGDNEDNPIKAES